VQPPAVLDCTPVGALRSLTIACALVLASVPVAVGASSDLTVAVSRLDVPTKIKGGKLASFGVRYVVRGPSARTALATVILDLTGPNNNSYHVDSLPAKVRPAIWRWNVQDTMPQLATGQYRAIATVTLTRAGKTISRTTSSTTLSVAAS
jgi:hypothetical protein